MPAVSLKLPLMVFERGHLSYNISWHLNHLTTHLNIISLTCFPFRKQPWILGLQRPQHEEGTVLMIKMTHYKHSVLLSWS